MFERPIWFIVYNEIKVAQLPNMLLYFLALMGLPLMATVLINQYSFMDTMFSNANSGLGVAAYYTHSFTLLFYAYLGTVLTFHYFKSYYRADETAFNALRNQFGIMFVSTLAFVVSKKAIYFHTEVGLLLTCILDMTILLISSQFYTTFNRSSRVFNIKENMMELPIFGRQLLTFAIHDLCRENVKILGGDDEVTTMLRKVVVFIRKEGKNLTPAFWNKHYDALFINKNKVSNNLGMALLKLRKYYYVEYLFEVALAREHTAMVKHLMPYLRKHALLDKTTIQYLKVMKMTTKDRLDFFISEVKDRDDLRVYCNRHLIDMESILDMIDEEDRKRIGC